MSGERLSEFDDAFTVYSWLFFSLHTGWRPPPDRILPDVSQVDRATGAFFLEDKLVRATTATTWDDEKADQGEVLDDNDDEDELALQANGSDKANTRAGLKMRWLPLGQRVLAQLRAYHHHVARRSTIALARPPKSSRDEIIEHLTRLLGLTEKLPWNFNRHHLRSNLVGRVSVEVINAYLGHWEKGSEPWANGSCLDPVAYVHEIHTALDELFPAEDWPVIHGFR